MKALLCVKLQIVSHKKRQSQPLTKESETPANQSNDCLFPNDIP